MQEAPRERNSFAVLLVAQIIFIFIIPFASNFGGGLRLLQLGVWSIILLGAYLAWRRRHLFITTLAIMIPTAAAWLGPDVFAEGVDHVLRLSTAALSFFWTAAVVVSFIASRESVTVDAILGGINVYLLLGFAFMFVHTAVLLAHPGSYSFGGETLHHYLHESDDHAAFTTLLYFSFTTLTTLGYGDIIPREGLARLITSAEAVIGQLYVAIFIGRLVALEVSRRTAGR